MKMTRSLGMGIRFIVAVICISWCELASAQELKPRAILEGHKDSVISLAFSPDSKTLASGSEDRTIRLWDAATGKGAATLKDDFTESLHFSPDGKILATVHSLEIGMWDLASRKRRVLQDDKWGSQCIRFMGSFSSDSKILATAGLCFSEVGLWDVDSGKLLRVLEDKSVEGYRLYTDVKITPDGKTVVVYGSVVGLRKWDVATGKSLSTVDLPKPYRTPDREERLEAAFSPDCKLMALSIPGEYTVKDGKETLKSPAYVTILDVASGKPTATFRGFSNDVWHLAFSSDGKTLATGNFSDDAVAALWDVVTSREIGSFKSSDGAIRSMVFRPDGKTLAIGYENKTIRLWDVPTKK